MEGAVKLSRLFTKYLFSLYLSFSICFSFRICSDDLVLELPSSDVTVVIKS